MDHNRAASYTWVFTGDTLTAGHQAESIRRFADTLGMTIVREYEDEEYSSGPGGRPQFQRMMDEARPESRPFGAVIACDPWRFAAGAADPAKYAKELRDAGVELFCVWNKPPRGAQVPGPGGGRRPEGPGEPAPATTRTTSTARWPRTTLSSPVAESSPAFIDTIPPL